MSKTAILDYLPDGPAPDKIPAGKILVHSHVKPKWERQQIGTNGFRAWWEEAANPEHRELCRCGWRADLGNHYSTDPVTKRIVAK